MATEGNATRRAAAAAASEVMEEVVPNVKRDGQACLLDLSHLTITESANDLEKYIGRVASDRTRRTRSLSFSYGDGNRLGDRCPFSSSSCTQVLVLVHVGTLCKGAKQKSL